MFRISFRLFVVAAVVLSLTVLAVPAAQARPLETPKAAIQLDSSWFQAALSWIFALVPTQGQQGHGTMQQATANDGTLTGTGLGTVRPQTGSCIDPLGGGWRCNL